MSTYGFSDEKPIDKIIFDYMGLDINGKPLKKVLVSIAEKYDESYKNLEPSFFRYRVRDLTEMFSYLISRVLSFYDVDEFKATYIKDYFWVLANSLKTVRMAENPWLDNEYKKQDTKNILAQKKEINVSSKEKSIGIISQVSLYKYKDDRLDINCCVYYNNEQLIIELSKLGSSYEDEYFIVIKNASLLLLYDKLEIKKDKKLALLNKLSTIFNGKDCFDKVKDFLTLNNISFEYLVRHD